MASLDLPEQKKLLIQQLDKALAEQARLTDKSKPSKVAENQKTNCTATKRFNHFKRAAHCRQNPHPTSRHPNLDLWRDF